MESEQQQNSEKTILKRMAEGSLIFINTLKVFTRYLKHIICQQVLNIRLPKRFQMTAYSMTMTQMKVWILIIEESMLLFHLAATKNPNLESLKIFQIVNSATVMSEPISTLCIALELMLKELIFIKSRHDK